MKRLLYRCIPCLTAFVLGICTFVIEAEAGSLRRTERNITADTKQTVRDILDGLEVGAMASDNTLAAPRQEAPAPDTDDTPDVVNEEDAFNAEDEYSSFAIADVSNYVNVRSTPGTDGKIVGKMYDGSVAEIVSSIGEGDETWFQIISGSVEGYIKAQYFIYGEDATAVIDEYVTHYAVVNADRLNVRKEPTTESSRIGYLNNGEKVKILEQEEGWHKVQYTDSSVGYVSADYVTVIEEYTHAKSLEEERAEQEAKKKAAARAAESEKKSPENTAVTPPSTDYATNEELRAAIVEYALQFVGDKYVSGGRSLASGTDCSGFTCYIYADFGYSISRTPQGQWSSNGRAISLDEIQPGDIVCYSSNGSKCTHVALYIGNGQIVHDANSKKGVCIAKIDYDDTFLGVKNVID